MAEYTDTKGRRWPVVATVRRVRELARQSGTEPAEWPKRLYTDPAFVADALAVFISDYCQARGVALGDVVDEMKGRHFTEAATALAEALADFFPAHLEPAARAVLAELRKQTTTADEASQSV